MSILTSMLAADMIHAFCTQGDITCVISILSSF